MPGLLPRGDHEAFEAGRARAHDLVGAEPLAGQLEQEGRPVMLQGPLDEPRLEGPQVARAGLPEAEIPQDLLEVAGPRVGSLAIGREGFGGVPSCWAR